MPFAFTAPLSLEQWGVGVPIEKAQGVATIDDEKQALIGIPGLGA